VALQTYPTGSLWPLRRIEQDPLAFLEMLSSSEEDIVQFRLGTLPAFLLNHPAHVESVLVKGATSFVKGRGYERAGMLLGSGLLTASGNLHAERRRLSQGAFRRHRMDAYAALIVSRTERLRAAWAAHSEIDVGQDMRLLTLGIAGECFFGADLSEYSDRIGHAISLATPRLDGLVSLVTHSRHVKRARHELDEIVGDILARRGRAERTYDDLLSLLLAAQTPNDAAAARQVRDDILTVLLAGHDTMTHALTWTWLLLSEHPEADAALYREIDDVLAACLPTADDVPRLPYTRSVLAEALRLFPPAWVIVRRAASSHTCGGASIPAGALVVASPFVLHRDPRYFPQPLRFMPERWLLSQQSTDSVPASEANRGAYFPFGAGPRSCIGESFAWMEGTLVLATLAQSWQLSNSGRAVRPSPRMTLRPDGPALMELKPRAHRRRATSRTLPGA
jgi:cytochrome P450